MEFPDNQNHSLLSQYKLASEKQKWMDKSHEMIGSCIKDLLLDPKVKVDNIIILSDMMIT